MATYEDIYGKRVKEFDSDPTLTSSYEGQVWYDKSSGTLKSVVALEAWSSSGSVITARYGVGSADQGSQTAGLIFGGATPPSNTFQSVTEEYNGSGFSSGGALPAITAEIRGAGTQTAALGFMGLTNPSTHTNASFEYDGSSWGSPTTMNTSRYDGGGNGTQTAGLGFGGYTTTSVANTEEYNGSAWTNVNSMNTARYSFGSAGIQTSAVALAGVTPPGRVNSVEEYDGTNWTTGTNYPLTISGIEGFGATNTAAIFAGGATSPPTLVTTCNSYDGTSFASVPSLGNSASSGGTGGTNTAGLYMSGIRTAPGTAGGDTEEFTKSINVITAAAWSSGGALGTARYQGGGAGIQTAALIFAGNAYTANTEEYDGTSFSEQNNLNTARRAVGGNGTQTAALACGGNTGPLAGVNNTEKYDGSSWTNTGTLNTARLALASFGIQTAAVAAGGYTSTAPGAVANVEEFDGSSWTAATALPAARNDLMAAGTLTAGLTFGGQPSNTNETKEYDGTNWTTGGNLIDGRASAAGSGLQTAALLFGGDTPGLVASTEGYDGTSWSTRPSLSTAVKMNSAATAGTPTAALSMTGLGPPGSATTASEEFTGVTETITASTLTTS